MRIWLHLKFGNTFQHFCLQFFWNSRSNVSCYGIISAFKRIVFCWWQTPFDAFVCVIIRASCKRQHPNAAVISNAIIVIKTLLFYNDLSNWISHAECTIYTRYRHMTFYLFIYYDVSLRLRLRYVNVTIIQLKLSFFQDRTATSSSWGPGVRA